MSSTGFAPVVLELPSWLLAERSALLAVVSCTVFVEAVMFRLPAGVHGIGLLAGCLLAGWHLAARRAGSRVCRAVIDPDGRWQVGFRDGRMATARLLAGSRVLGPTAVLRWKVEGRSRAVWLTPVDLPWADLRMLRVRLSVADLQVRT